MHYYSFNLGDYTSHTAHLSPIEDIAYRRLLDLYYQTESPIANDLKAICRQIRMRDHSEDVKLVLEEFFVLDGEFWRSNRCDREIADYKKKADSARVNGRKGGRPKNPARTQKEPKENPVGYFGFQSANPDATQEEPSEKLTNNHEPRTTHTDALDALPCADAGFHDLPELHELPKQSASNSHPLAGVVCKAIKMTGIGMVNPGHPKLNALLHSGVTVEQVTDACKRALEKGKNFTYALGILVREEEEARNLATSLANSPRQVKNEQAQPKSFAQQERERGWLRWEEMTGREHEELRKLRESGEVAQRPMVIDMQESQQQLLGGMQ